MARKVYVRDLVVLHNLDEGLSKFNYGASDVLERVNRNIRESQAHLRSRTNYWQTELRRRENALRACERARDDKGRGYDCSKEAAAVQQARDALEKLQRLSSRLEQAVGEYNPHANHLQNLLGGKINKAKRDLNRSVKKYQAYAAYSGHASASPSIGYLRQKAVKKAWTQEQELVRLVSEGTRNWTNRQKELLRQGKIIANYQGHHIRDVSSHSNKWAADPRNIRFVTRREHLATHGGSYRNPTTGKLIDRPKLINMAKKNLLFRRD